MKTRIILVIGIPLLIAALLILIQDSAALELNIELSSDPYPLVIGQTNMLVKLTDNQGKSVLGATVKAEGIMDHEGAMPVPVYGQVAELSDGQYVVSMMWSMDGRWIFDVTAELPEQQVGVHEEYDIYVYPMTPAVELENATFKSVREIDAMVSANADKELWVVIPQGTRSMMQTGHFDHVIPEDIVLSVSGQNTIIIRNDDIVAHTLGPFYIRSGETIRQTFNRPQVLQGTCTISYSGEINFVVEE